MDGVGDTVDLTSNETLTGSPLTTPTFTNGVLASQAVTLTSTSGGAASATITATRTGGGGNIGPQIAGTSFNIKITAGDQFNNTLDSGVNKFSGNGFRVQLTSTQTLSLPNPANSADFTDGVLTSEAVTLTSTGSATITAINGVSTASAPFTVSHAPADHLAFTTTPGNAIAGATLTAVVEVQDAFNNRVTSGGDEDQNLTLNIKAGSPTTAFAAGTLVKNATAGVATFADLVVEVIAAGNYVGTNKVLRFSAGMNGGMVDSGAFTITHAAATRLVITTAPSASTVNFAQ